MARHLGIIAHNAIISHFAVVCNMAIRHDQAIAPHLGGPAVLTTPVNGNKFTDGCIVANLHSGGFVVKFKILGYSGDHCTRENTAVFSNPRPFHYGYIAANPCAFTHFNIMMNYGKWINFYVVGKVCIGVYIRQRMYHKLFRAIDRPRTVKHRLVWENTIIAGSCR